jgi:hypothetical protein
MPTPSITTTYAGEFAKEYISAALLEGSTIANGGITVKPNVKYKEVIKKVATSGIIGNASCDFTDAGTLTLTERIIQPEEFQVNLELCKSDFNNDWEAVQQGISAFDSLPPTFADFLLGHVAGKVAEKTEQNIWGGTNATAGEFDGFTTLAAADSDVIDVTGTTVTAANVVDELGKIVDVIPSALYGNEDMHIYISQNIARAYVRALGGFGASGLGANGTNAQGTQWWNNGALTFDGVKLFVANGLADNKAMAAEKSNLYFGTGLISDMNEVKVLDMADLDGSQNARVIMRFTASVQYGIGSEIVYYTA